MDRSVMEHSKRNRRAGSDGAVSVVIPVRNGEPFIAETIASILAQGPCIGEVIVVDDGSSDDSAGAALSLGDPRVRVTGTGGRGVSAARNHGAAEASGEWLYFIDADDLAYPGAIERLLAAARQAPDAELVYGEFDRIGHDGASAGVRRGLVRFRRKPTGDVLETVISRNFMTVGCQIVRRSLHDACGGFDESLKIGEDWHFWCKAAARTRFLFVPDLCVMSYRLHDASACHSRLLPFEALAPAIDAIYGDPAITGRIGAARLAQLRRRAEAAQMSYIASVAVRMGVYGAGLKMLLRSVRHDPRRTLRAVCQSTGALVGL